MGLELNLAFIRTIDTPSLETALLVVNRTRHHEVPYERVILTAGRQGWSAIVIDHSLPDHYLLRNLSGRLNTTAFELNANELTFGYRLHRDGQTLGAFESHLGLWINQRLRLVINMRDVKRLDLAEPAERFVLQLYHEHQRVRPWSQPSVRQTIPSQIDQYYRGSVQHLKSLVQPSIALNYLEDVFRPGMAAQAAIERLMGVLNLPYLPGDRIEIANEDEDDLAGYNDPNINTMVQEVVEGYAILDPTYWRGRLLTLPKGWRMIDYRRWEE